MNVALIRRRFAEVGGAELYLRRLLRCLAARGHTLHVFCESWEQPPDGVTIHPVRISGNRARRPVLFAKEVDTAIRKCSFDCVFSLERTWNQNVYRAGDGLHRVWLDRRRAFAPAWKRPWIGLGRFHRAMLRLEARTFDPSATGHVIVNSDMVRREVIRHFSFPASRIHLVRNGVDVGELRSGDRAAGRRRYAVHENERVLLFAGSGWERKGLKYLLAATKELTRRRSEPIRLLVAGRGRPPMHALRYVTFCGPVKASEMKDLYAAADLFVFLPIYEPSANVCCEALAAGLPVVTTRFNGASEWIEPGVTGSVLDDPADLERVVDEIAGWLQRGPGRVTPDLQSLSLERNANETIAVLERAGLAARAPRNAKASTGT